YSDVIIGADRYDNGQDTEGKVFVYHGSAAGLANTPAWTAEGNQANAYFGVSVATAGDVNGDGFADVIVGADVYSNGQSGEGRAFVYHGSGAGLAATPAWTAESNQVDGDFGYSVASAGDVNGDGYADVIVGAGAYSNGQTAEGRAYVYHGSAAGLAANAAWITESNLASSAFGSAVAGAGDVNGDGYSDVIVGAYAVTNGQSTEGRAYVYHGSASGLSLEPVWIVESNQENSFFGSAVETAGDVNGDGFADVLIGAYLYDNGQDAEGSAFAYYGSAGGLSGTPSWIGESNQTGGLFGAQVGTAGDVNGDGYADVIIGATGYDNGESDEGRAYVYLGSKLGLISAAWIVESDQASAVMGSAVATAGDVNGDGYSDVVVAVIGYDHPETNEGRALVYHGGPSGLTSMPMFWAPAGQSLGFWGWVVGSAGDVNGDGYSDLFAVASNFDNGQGDEGKVWVYHGSIDGVPSSPSWSAETNQVSAEIGSAACAGDFNGDGYSDFIYGSPYYETGESNEGAAFLHLGSASGLSPTPLWIIEGGQVSAWAGTVAGAGDVDGDGYGDILIGAEGYDNEHANEGRVSLYRGSASGLGLSTWSVEGGEDGALLGHALAPAGDVNRDGFADVLIGVPLLDHGESDEGVVWVFHGTTGGLSTTPARILEANQANASFGSQVAPAGDVNGDGYSDVIIGADHFDCGQVDEGKAFLYYGGAQGLPASPAWTAESDQASAWFGKAVGTAGDVNGDGYSDLIIGAPLYDDGETDEGRVWIYHGSPTVPGPPVLLTQGDQPGALYGYSVGTAGDVNADGFSEVVAGAPGYDFNGVHDGGLVLVLPGNQGDGLHRPRRQMRVNDLAPIAIGGKSDSPSAFRVQALARTPAGRGRVRLEIEAKPLGTPFNGTGLVRSPFVGTGFPAIDGSAVSVLESLFGLQAGRVYHWRLRIASDSPFFPRSPWLWHPGNSVGEGDVRIGGPPVGIADSEAPPVTGVVLSPAVPNPFAASTAFALTLPARGAVRLGVYDVQGRFVATLAEGMQPAGRQEMHWDGRNSSGHALPGGVYFVRLESGGQVTAQKVVIRR
ncbi:MAG TPA: FG-GAP-like repeat-containing protein, partial [Candidatus Udaeobacter sp.]|nr:FG-GAP-like repeat-containing protein [Candidatus Udaeobacter sp.]